MNMIYYLFGFFIILCFPLWKRYKYSVEEVKYDIRRNINGKILDCRKSYFIVKRVFPFGKKYIWLSKGDFAQVMMFDYMSGATDFGTREKAEEILNDIRTNPDKYYYNDR